MSLSSCLDKARLEIRRQKIVLQKAKKSDEALAYERDQNLALDSIANSLGEIDDDAKAIAKIKSLIESLSLDRDEIVVQIEANGGKATDAPYQVEDLEVAAPKPLNIGDAIKVANIDAILADAETVDGVRYELFNANKLSDKRGITRVTDIDSNSVVSITTYPEYDAAEAEFEKAVDVSAKAVEDVPAAVAPVAQSPVEDKAATSTRMDTADSKSTDDTASRRSDLDSSLANDAEDSKPATVNAEITPKSEPISFTREGDFWNYYGERAKEIAKALDLVATTRNGQSMVAIADHQREQMVGELESAGIDAVFAGENAKNDRDTFTLNRLNQESGEMESVSFERGEYVQYAVSGKKLFGEISGISHAKREFAVDGLWYPMGFAYKADRPEIVDSVPKVPLSSVIDSVNKKHGEGLTEADRIPSTDGIVERHSATIAKMFEGELSIDEFKAAFALVRDNQIAIEAELTKLKKDALLKMGGAHFAYRYKTETKPVIIRGLYGDMLNDFTLNKTLSYFVGGNMADQKNKAIQKIVDESTQADMDAFGEKVKERRAANEQRAEEIKSAVSDPKTLDDFRLYMRAETAKGKTVQEARMSLSLDQRIAYDDLAAADSRKSRADRKETANTNITAAAVTTAGELFETKHTKTGDDLFVVKTADRVERDVYSQWLATAKKLDGYYSSFRGNGAIPGFTFKDKDNALAFMQFVGGDTTAAKEAVKEERNAYADDKAQSAVERLAEMADRLDERADESLGQERRANTSRRARFAASAEAAASSDKALAKTMRNIANAISSGSAKFLDKVRQKSQVEMLRSVIGQAKYQELITKYTSYANQEQHKGEPATAETADFARWPQFTAMRSDLASLGRDLLQIDGAKLLGKQLLKVADDVTDAYTKFAKENLHKVSTFSTPDGKPAVFGTEDKALAAINRSGYKGKAAVVSFKRGEHMVVMGPEMAKEKGLWAGDTDKRITLTPEFGEEIVAKNKAFGKRHRISMPYLFDNVSQERARWKALGIESPAEMRAALREFVNLQERPAEADKIKQMERAMIGRKNDGLDFFPTPASAAQDMIDAAEIEPGMSVLEPSAGMGHIAEQIREAGVDPDVIEYGSDRRELLEAKGFRVVGNDFMDMTPRSFTFGDVFKDQDGTLGVMRGSGGLGSNRVGFQLLDANGNPDARESTWVDRDELTGVEKRASDAGYDRIIMNPPFSERRDAEHVQHAFTLLKPGGRIVAIMGEGVFFGQDAKAKAFREWLDSVGGTSEKLAEGTFLDPSLPVNTGVAARMVVIDRPVESVESNEVNQLDPFYDHYQNQANRFNNAPEWERSAIGDDGIYAKSNTGALRRNVAGRSGRIEANGMPRWVRNSQPKVADYIGQSINTPEDLADIAQVYRDPRYETMRYFFVKNGVIVSQNAVSSRLPGSSSVFIGKTTEEQMAWVNRISKEASLLGADGVYLLHNHPNGDPSASDGDLDATESILKEMAVRGINTLAHVIINHNKYGVISPDANGRIARYVVLKEYSADEQYSFNNPKVAHPVLGSQAISPKDVAKVAKQAQVSSGEVVIVGIAGTSGVSLLAEVTPAQISSPKVASAIMRRLARQSGSSHMYAYGLPYASMNAMAKAIRSGIIVDAIVIDENGVEWSVAGVTGAKPEQGVHFGLKAYAGEVNAPSFNLNNLRDSAYQSAKDGIDKLTSAETKDTLIYTFQNKFIDLKRIQDAVKGLGKHISELADAYLGEELYHGRLAKRSQDFLANEMRPLLEGLQKAGISVPEFERFLHARHAVERNAEMAKRNPNDAEINQRLFEAEMEFDDISDRIDNGESLGKELVQAKKEVSKWRNAQAFDGTEDDRLSLSGMTDDEANSILSGKSPEDRKVLDQFAAEIDAINAETLNTLEAYGLETPETIDEWKNKWKHYIPLHRDDAHPDSIGHPTGSGFSTKGSASKRATGSNAKVTNILAHIAMQREAALTRGEKNEVSKKVYLLAKENPDKDLWMAGPPPTQQILNPNTGLVETVIDPLYKMRDNVLMVRINGKDMALTFNERNAQGVRLAMALKNLDGSDLDIVESVVAKGTRWFASINTQFNPIFGIINLLRDSQTGALNLTSTKLEGKQKQLVSGIWPALKAIYQQERHGKGDPAWTKLFEEYSLAGGTTGYRDLFARADDRAKALQAEFDKGDRGNVSKLAHGMADWLSDFNTAMENSTRLAAYKVARDMGLSEAESASIAKNLTVNFNRKGSAATKLGAFYAFFNASLQGSTRMIQTLKGPAGKKIIAGGIGLGFLSAAMGMAGMGDDEWEKIPEFVRERSLIIPLPDGKFFTIPMPLGFHVLPNIGRKAAEMAFGSNKKSKAKHLGELMGVVADAFNPMGSSSSVAQMAAPTVLDPVVALLENKDWTGKPIYREDMNGMKPTPGFARAKDTASTFSTSIAHFLNNATGGTDFTPGMVSWTPDQIDYVFGQLTGGVGREVLKADQVIRGAVTGEDIPPHKIPLLGRFYGETTGPTGESAPFYDNIKRINLASAEVKGLREAGRAQEAAEYLKDHPDAKLGKQADKTYREIAKLRKARSDAIERGEKARVKLIEQNMAAKMRQFNQSVI